MEKKNKKQNMKLIAHHGENAVFMEACRFVEAFPTLRCIFNESLQDVSVIKNTVLQEYLSCSQVSLDNP